MASASSSSARHLFSDTKKRLAGRIGVNVNNIGSVARQIVRGSKSNEILGQVTKNFAQLEYTMDNTAQNLRQMESYRNHIGQQYDIIKQNAENLEYIQEQVDSMQR